MELVSRILDGSIPYNSRGEPLGPSFFGGRISQDDRITRLEEVSLLQGCSRKQLRKIAKISANVMSTAPFAVPCSMLTTEKPRSASAPSRLASGIRC